jgi:Chromo (CHRromatin Organisation MOdifier) domain
VDREEEWVVEEVLDSKVINRKLWYLIKWEGLGIEHNSWEPWDSVHAPDLIAEFYWKHPGAAHQVRAIDCSAISFYVMLSRHSLKGGVDVRGHPFSLPSHSDCYNFKQYI